VQSRLKPTAIGGGLSWEQVSGRYNATCGVAADHRAYCWGENGDGQLGNGTTTQHLVPAPVAAPL
jgi:alpha-tubulin suppressor-like RCC1 family protein